MARCYAKIKGEVINPIEKTTTKGTKIISFGIKIDTKDYRTNEWNTIFMNGTLISDFTSLKNKTIYEFDGTLDADIYTDKNGNEIKNITFTAFQAEEINNKNKGNQDIEPPVVEKEKKSFDSIVEDVFAFNPLEEEDEEAPF